MPSPQLSASAKCGRIINHCVNKWFAAIQKRRGLIFCLIPVLLLLAFAFSLPDPLFDVSYSPVLYDREGKLLGAKVAADGQWRFPGVESLNEKFVIAVMEAEDRRFRRHFGVDPRAIARAAIQNFRAGRVVSGASTITMQTIRLARGFRKRTVFEKCVEMILALRLEIGRSKDEILVLYAANAPFGANVVGIEAAAWRWFGRSPEDLSWAEAATLAVLPNNPALIHPGRNRESLRKKRDSLLSKLYVSGRFDAETLALSMAEPLPNEPLPLPRLAPHLLDRLVIEAGGVGVLKDNAAFVTTIERDIQERAAAILNRASERFASNGIFNGACVVVDTQTGEIAAYVGNTAAIHAADVDNVVSRRSSGSLLKPFLYAAMLDTGDMLPASILSDIPTRVGSYSPENITGTYLGVVPADEALARSLNVTAARSLRVYGVDRFARFLRSLGLTTFFRPGDEYGLPLILGGAEITLFEMTGLYAGLGRAANAFSDTPASEVFFPPLIFSRENQSTGSGFPFGTSKKSAAGNATAAGRLISSLISPGAAWLTLEALVHGTRPGEEAIWQEYAGARNIAWKTGTSFGYRDAWTIGVTPEWTVGVWIGNASGEGRAELRGGITAAPVFFEIFSSLDSFGGNRRSWFRKPVTELRQVETCAASGFPASVNCVGTKLTDIPANAPAAVACRYCRTIILVESPGSKSGKSVAGAGSPLYRRIILEPGVSAATVERKWFVLPPAEEWYFRRWNLDYKPLPPFLNAPESSGDGVLALFNPEPDSQIYVPRELDGSEGRIVFSAAHRNETEIIYWHLDEKYLGATQTFHEMEARPEPGLRKLTLVDSTGNTIVRRFTVLDAQ